MQVHHGQADLSARLLPMSNAISEVHATITSVGFPGDATEGRNTFEAVIDAEINRYRDVLNDGRPKTALSLFLPLLKRVSDTASGRILFRIKANIGHCYLVQGEDARAAHWLSEAYHHAPSEPKAIANYTLALLLQKRLMEAFNFGMRQLKLDGTNGWVAGYVIQAVSRCPELPDPIIEMTTVAARPC